MRTASQKDNRKDVVEEHQKARQNPREEIRNEKKKREAEILQSRLEAEEQGEDYERKRSLNYTVEAVERYDKKMKEKEKRMDTRFTDFTQVAAKKYKRMVKVIKPNLEQYQAIAAGRDATGMLVDGEDANGELNSQAYAVVGNKPSASSIEKVVRDIEKQNERRKAYSRRRAHREDEDVTYINERNMRFNKKIARAYDKHTSDIKAAFERGTAL
ncbi:hypothetical protein HDV05_004382 [Chytridiales sp. JEL 0842]|nr:hypothetical protein HDV05_004382 [Chytridiales sp. JEL 0842]